MMLMVVLMLIRVTGRKFGIMAERVSLLRALWSWALISWDTKSFLFSWADIFHTSL